MKSALRGKMPPRSYAILFFLLILPVVGIGFAPAQQVPKLPKKLDFNRDVRPILAANCFACHGQDANKRQAGLRLDKPEGAYLKLPSGKIALVPGRPDASELIARITTKSPLLMPPASSGKTLTPEQIATLRRWVAQGGKYAPHWAYAPLHRPAVPNITRQQAGKWAQWPRNPIDRFILDRLLDEGLRPSRTADRPALLRRLSFDLVGLPPTPAEVAAFVADRSPNAYEKVVDRLLASPHYGERMAMDWLDWARYADTDGYHGDRHRNVSPYRDYVIAAFNSNMPFDRFTIENLAGDLLPNATREQKIASAFNRLNMVTREGGAQAKEYLAKYAAERVRTVSLLWQGATLGCAECHDHKFDPYTTRDFYRFSAFFADIKQVGVAGGEEEIEPVLLLPTPEQEQEHARLDARIATLESVVNTPTPALEDAQAQWELTVKTHRPDTIPVGVTFALDIAPEKRNDKQKREIADYYRSIAPALDAPRKELADQKRQRDALLNAIPRTLVTIAVTPAVTRVLPRGNWMDDSGEIAPPSVPAFLPPLQTSNERATRLDLANWLIAPDNPLTARVIVNRFWKRLFGNGLVKTTGDSGTQGSPPTHPELLDWLASEFQSRGWDIKHIMKLIVLSNTYKQTSLAPKPLQERDPYNALLARQSRFRLDAELVRDNALAICGLLSEKIGGRSVMPYQPDGYWDHCNTFAGPLVYHQDHGEDLYRRGVYSYWKRSFLHPSLLAFDAPTREECSIERPRSNTPLQALVLLNDPTYVEAARAFAQIIVAQGGTEAQARIDWAFHRALGRSAHPEEVRILTALVSKHQKEYAADRVSAEKLLKVGEYPVPQGMDAAELAAWTSAARVILNLHETITRE